MCMCAGLRGKSVVSRRSVSSEQSELIRRVGQMKYSARYSQAGPQETERCVFLFCLFYQPFIPGKSIEHRCSSSTVPSFSFMQTKHSHLLLLTEQLHWSTEGGIIKVFPSLFAGITGSGPDIDNTAVLSQCLEAYNVCFFLHFSILKSHRNIRKDCCC